MHYHIILTERCNSRCKYCYEKSMDEFENGLEKKWNYDLEVPVDSEVSVDKLKEFLKPSDTLIFYGGEPLVKIDKIKEIIDNVPCRFCMQSNGKLLDQLPFEYVQKIEKILISMDGDEKRTDFNRGKGNYSLVLKNLKELRKKGYSGEIVARMVISKFPDVFEQVKHLIGLKEIDSVHFQIDAGFYKNDFNEKEFSKFVKEYKKSLKKLFEFWIKEMRKGKVLKIYPFVGILNRLRGKDKEMGIPCGSGYKNFTITTKGKLSACPIMNSVEDFYCGSLEEGIKKKISIIHEDCSNCSYLSVCGGRCLYWRGADLWPKEGNNLICDTIKFLIDLIRDGIPEIEKLISYGIISEKDFEIENYFGPEIIP